MYLTKHAYKRMKQRSITRSQVSYVLEHGVRIPNPKGDATFVMCLPRLHLDLRRPPHDVLGLVAVTNGGEKVITAYFSLSKAKRLTQQIHS